jgi:hypothetical protein
MVASFRAARVSKRILHFFSILLAAEAYHDTLVVEIVVGVWLSALLDETEFG